MIPSSGSHTISSTIFRNFFRLWLAGIVCFVLITVQMMVNLSAVHSNQGNPMLEDGIHLPPLDPRGRRNKAAASKQRSPTLAIHTIDAKDSVHQQEGSPQIIRLRHGENSKSLPTTSNWSIETSFLYTSPEYGRIRRWGCHLSTTPFIFVHIGKAGGGSVRARLAASSLNYTKKDYSQLDFSYYPLKRRSSKNRTPHVQCDDDDRAQFCESGYNMFNLQPSPQLFKSFQCHASTPLGQAIACPELYLNIYDPDRVEHLRQNNIKVAEVERSSGRKRRHPCFYPPSSDHAHLVFAGHHNFGAELHWLPARMLSMWWDKLWASTRHEKIVSSTSNAASTSRQAGDRVAQWFLSLQTAFNTSKFLGHAENEADVRNDRHSWCKGQPRPIFGYGETTTFHQSCSQELFQPIDELANEAVQRRMASAHMNSTAAERWSTLYASLPVLRVTVLRKPFSWLCSKFFWHQYDEQFHVACDDVGVATDGDWTTILRDNQPQGWARRFALQYLQQLCGDDCVVRSYNGNTSNLHEIERQASANLRQGFAVVGLMSDIDEFYDMLNRRVAYLNTSLNPHVVGDRHESSSLLAPEEVARCKRMFRQNRTFQTLMLRLSPEIRALQRVYQLGVEVNRFHRTELLMQC